MVLLSAKLHNNLKTLSNKPFEIIVTIKQLNGVPLLFILL